MILSVMAYGNSILKKKAEKIPRDYDGLSELIENMWETMYNAQGVGLAAPQIGVSGTIFVIDTTQTSDEEKEVEGIKKAFVNPIMLSAEGERWTYEEGCLSIPNIRGEVDRPQSIRIRYHDEEFNLHEDVFKGINARVIQHEYDHLEGILFIEKIKPLKRRLIKRKLESIKKGHIEVDYRMKFKN